MFLLRFETKVHNCNTRKIKNRYCIINRTLGGQNLRSTIFRKYSKFYVVRTILFSEESVYLRLVSLEL